MREAVGKKIAANQRAQARAKKEKKEMLDMARKLAAAAASDGGSKLMEREQDIKSQQEDVNVLIEEKAKVRIFDVNACCCCRQSSLFFAPLPAEIPLRTWYGAGLVFYSFVNFCY